MIWGSGTYVNALKHKIDELGINNLIYKGVLPKEKIPGILTKSDVNLRHYKKMSIFRFGTSQNKEFEYFAAGKPVLSTIDAGFSLIKKYQCGIEVNGENLQELICACQNLYNLSRDEKRKMELNARNVAEAYDFSALTAKLINVIEQTEKRYEEKAFKKN